MRIFAIAFAWLFLVPSSVGQATTSGDGKKVALVIGNSLYAHAVKLPNPARDAGLMAKTLREAGFAVIEGEDLSKTGMNDAIDRFTEAAYEADVALVYYAGHGLQVDSRNYLIPVDAQLEKAAHLQSRTISVDYLLSKLPADPAVSILILDACRDNPLARTLAAAFPKSRSSAIGSGLAAVQANAQSLGSGGLLIAYATDPGAVAYDGGDSHSPYTIALARHLTAPGLEIQSALTRVRADVSEATRGAQRPWHNASLAREVFLGGEPPAIEVPTQPPEQQVQPAAPEAQSVDAVEQATWEEASKRNTITHYEYYLSKFPNGQFAGLAKINIDQLKTAEVEPASVTPRGMDVAALAVESPPAGETAKTGSRTPETPGSTETEALLKLDKQGRIDLQLRLTALDYDVGDFDGSLGTRTRAAIGAWQRQNGLPESTYLTSQQHLLLVGQTESLMAGMHTKYEAGRIKAKPPEKNTKAKTERKPNSANSKKKEAVATPSKETALKDSKIVTKDDSKSRKRNKGPGAIAYCRKWKTNIIQYEGCLDLFSW